MIKRQATQLLNGIGGATGAGEKGPMDTSVNAQQVLDILEEELEADTVVQELFGRFATAVTAASGGIGAGSSVERLMPKSAYLQFLREQQGMQVQREGLTPHQHPLLWRPAPYVLTTPMCVPGSGPADVATARGGCRSGSRMEACVQAHAPHARQRGAHERRRERRRSRAQFQGMPHRVRLPSRALFAPQRSLCAAWPRTGDPRAPPDRCGQSISGLNALPPTPCL